MPQRPPDVTPEIVKGDLTEELLEAYLSGPDLAVDTETMGLQTRRDRLCLVQLCDRRSRAAIVQVPAEGLEASVPLDRRLPRLRLLMQDPGVLKVFHFARFDVAALRYWAGIDAAPLYCTRTASKLARTYTDRHGLKDNLLEFLDVELDKVTRHSDWSSPVLSPEQVRYAISDVTMLLPLMDRLQQMLERQGRAALARECFTVIPTLAKLDIAGFDLLFEH
jgi:ribonuclease D